jgi:hypothetical protein
VRESEGVRKREKGKRERKRSSGNKRQASIEIKVHLISYKKYHARVFIICCEDV